MQILPVYNQYSEDKFIQTGFIGTFSKDLFNFQFFLAFIQTSNFFPSIFSDFTFVSCRLDEDSCA